MDYSKYMPQGGSSSGGGDYQKYYSKYMSQGSAKGGSGQGGDYQKYYSKYMSQYAGHSSQGAENKDESSQTVNGKDDATGSPTIKLISMDAHDDKSEAEDNYAKKYMSSETHGSEAGGNFQGDFTS